MKRFLLFTLSLIVFFLFFFILKSEKALIYTIPQKGESFFEGLKIIKKNNGKSDWILTARRADIKQNGSIAHLIDIEMTLQDRGIIINAEKGFYNLTTKNIVIDGHVIAKNDNYSLTTEDVKLENSAGSLKTSSAVKVEGKTFTLHGKGMEIDSSGQKVRILRDVKATFNN